MRCGPATATQVQGILDAAQATAAEIERGPRSDAQRIREEAARDAERAREHVETLARATAALRERVQALGSEVGALAESLLVGEREPPATAPALPVPTSVPSVVLPAQAPAPVPAPPEPASAPSAFVSQVPATARPAPASVQGGNDPNGARLVALNMALNGESREQADRYLADSFELADRESCSTSTPPSRAERLATPGAAHPSTMRAQQIDAPVAQWSTATYGVPKSSGLSSRRSRVRISLQAHY